MEFGANEQALRESGRYPWDESGTRSSSFLSWLAGPRERTRDVSRETAERMREARETAGHYIHRYPFSTVALAAVVGFAAGVLVARR